MRTDRVKRCMCLSILLLMTGCGAGKSTELKPDLQEKLLAEAESPIESESKDESESKTESEIKIEPESGSKAGFELRPIELFSEDDEFYVQCLQNLEQGNCITYADGYYYFRSQTENYSLCRTKGAGMPVEVVADQIPGSIYVRENQVYFINISDSRTLYCVGTDGSGLKNLFDFPMQELIVLEDKIYFRSVYDREYDPFYQLTEEAAEDDRYIYSMNLDGSGCELLVPRVCMEFMTDGRWLYYLVCEERERYVLYKSGLDGKEEEEILHKKDWIWNILPYHGDLYWVDSGQNQLMRLNAQGEEEILASDVWRFTITTGQIYIMNEEEIRTVGLTTGEESLFAKKEEASGSSGQNGKDIHPWYTGSYYNRGIFLVNGQVLAKYFESGKKGVLWHIWDGETFVVFEDMEPLTAEELVLDTSFLNGEILFYCPGRTDEDAEQYLDADGEFCYEEAFGTREDGSTYGNFRITLPKFNSKLASYKQLNRYMEGLLGLALEDKESFFQEIAERDQDRISWYRVHGYHNLYVGENYISMYYYRRGYSGGMRDWNNPMPLIFDRETGLMLHMDDIFTVEESIYMKRLTSAIYKYCEMMGMDWWNDAFENNVLVINFSDLRCYLTPDGIVLCYERYEIAPGASGSPTFEIPYEWFEDIFK